MTLNPAEERRQKIEQKVNMKRYLEILTALTGRSIHPNDLESLENTSSLSEIAQDHFINSTTSTFEIPFQERLSERFKNFVQQLYATNSSAIYIWEKRTKSCGILISPSILSINFNFDFAIDSSGIFSFSTINMTDAVMLDFFISDEGEQRLLVKSRGANWGEVKY